MLIRKRPSRDRIVERAILITSTARDMEACVEHFSLYNSATIVLEKNSEVYATTESPGVARLLAINLTFMWCVVQAIKSPFTKSDLRKAIADAFRLAKKELASEDESFFAEVKHVVEGISCDERYCTEDSNTALGYYGYEDVHKFVARVTEYILDGTHECQLPTALKDMREVDRTAYECLCELIPSISGTVQHA